MKKVLVYMNKNSLTPTGGPTGYNYNLLCGLREIGCDNEIDYLDYDSSSKRKVNNFVDSVKVNWLKASLKILKSLVHKTRLFYGKNKYAKVDLNQYDIVHFHGFYMMWECKDSLRSYKGKVILTQHSPNRPAIEYFNAQTSFEKKYMRWFYKKLFEMDQWALNKADFVFFPCEEAEEPYLKHWPYFSEYKKMNPERFRYILSGIEPVKSNISRTDVRNKYNIPEDATVICYVGRHNEIKGYDLLQEMAKELLKDNKVYFLIAGREGPLHGLNHERWIEVGWTRDPYSYVTASDIFVLPNRETYFDLVMLEVLSLGAIVVASNTGGNKLFSKMKPNGVFLYDDISEAVKKIRDIEKLQEVEKDKIRKLNTAMFREHFTSTVFANHYMEILRKI